MKDDADDPRKVAGGSRPHGFETPPGPGGTDDPHTTPLRLNSLKAGIGEVHTTHGAAVITGPAGAHLRISRSSGEELTLRPGQWTRLEPGDSASVVE